MMQQRIDRYRRSANGPATYHYTVPTKDSTPKAKSNSAVEWYLWTALALVILRLWLQPMSSGFWLDEIGTFLIVQGSFSQMVEK